PVAKDVFVFDEGDGRRDVQAVRKDCLSPVVDWAQVDAVDAAGDGVVVLVGGAVAHAQPARREAGGFLGGKKWTGCCGHIESPAPSRGPPHYLKKDLLH